MALLSPHQILRQTSTTGRLVIAGFGLCLALAGCGGTATANSGAAAASATPTCPPTGTFKSVSGTISATGSNTITVTDSSGAPVVVQLTSSTRITKQVTVAPASIAAGTSVLIVSDTNATTAQRISVLAAGGGFGGGGFGGGRFGGGQGTPGAGRNSACVSRTPGAGRPGGTGGAFQGLRGTVDSVTSSQIVINDTQGQTFSLAITSATVTTSSASGSTADLVSGAKVSASGTASGSQINAATITVQAAG
jgi:hypothetical protein